MRVSEAAGDGIATTCAYCGVGCGLRAQVRDGPARQVRVAPDAQHPANLGRWCAKGAALGETLSLEGRLLHPHMDGRRVFWGEALDRIAATFARIRAEHGPDAIAFYVSGQLLTEDYYVANKFVKGFLGTANIDTNSRLCMASTVAAQKRAFGADVVPACYEDLELADLVVLVGSNTAWCHPVLFQRLAAARAQRGTKVVVVDTRLTATASIADLALVLEPGSDASLFNGLLVYLAAQGALDQPYIDAHTQGFAAALSVARLDAPDIDAVAFHTGLAAADIAAFYAMVAATPRTVTAWSQGVNQSSHGTDTVNTILNLHLATGRIGRPGAGPLSFTGQPNAMGGREVGGLANQLAAHMALEDAAARRRVAAFWQSPGIADRPGLKAVELFDAIDAGRVRALWVLGTNPAASLPDAARVDAALAKLELPVVSDCVAGTDTLRHAHVQLPALAWGEKNGTVTNSERRLSRQRALVAPPGEARADWWAISQVAHRLGYRAQFPYTAPAQVLREHAALSALDNSARRGRRAFDIGALAQLSDEDYDALEPLQWPAGTASPRGTARLFAHGGFFHPDGMARFVPVGNRRVVAGVDAQYPYALTTGRVRDQWHTMTRTGAVARLAAHRDEPFVELHPADAAACGIADGGLARLASPLGAVLLRVRVAPGAAPGRLFAPMHWTRAQSTGGVVNALVAPACDPVSGQPAFKHTPVALVPFRAACEAVVLSRERLPLPALDYAVGVREAACWRLQLATAQAPPALLPWLRSLLPAGLAGEWQQMEDGAAGRAVLACVRDGELVAVALASTRGRPARVAWLAALFGSPLGEDARMHLLDALPPGAVPAGRTVCACLGVGEEALRAAGQGCCSVEDLVARTRAGSRCGTCLPELAGYLAPAGEAVVSASAPA